MSSLHYVVGDATKPVVVPCVIAHITNNRGGWGKGFVLALEEAFPGLGAKWKARRQRLGEVHVDQVGPMVQVAHLCAQDGYKSKANPVPVKYASLISCLGSLRSHTGYRGCGGVHMPRIGAGLGGGNWKVIETFIKEELVDHGVDVYVYDLPQEKK